jgi:hypothetical protein
VRPRERAAGIEFTYAVRNTTSVDLH